MELARSLRSGMTAVNSVIGVRGVPSLPFGGSGDSGFGRIHGADGLREFARPKSITRQRIKPMVNLTSLSRSDKDMKRILGLATMLHGKRYKYAAALTRLAPEAWAPPAGDAGARHGGAVPEWGS